MTQKILGLKRRVAQRKYLTRACFGNTVQLQHFTSVPFFSQTNTQSLVQESGQTHSRVRLVMVPRYLKSTRVPKLLDRVYTRRVGFNLETQTGYSHEYHLCYYSTRPWLRFIIFPSPELRIAQSTRNREFCFLFFYYKNKDFPDFLFLFLGKNSLKVFFSVYFLVLLNHCVKIVVFKFLGNH